MTEKNEVQEKRVRWSDRGEWCDRCAQAKAVWSGLCEPCHALPQPPKNGIVIGGYTIRPFSDGDFWIENPIGEGMQVKAPALEKLIEDYFTATY